MALMANLLPITGIGSLPHQDIENAISYSLKHDIPFLPELPHLDGTMEKVTENSCLKEFLQRTNHLIIRKIQSPSPEINSFKINQFDNCINFIDAPLIKDEEMLLNTLRGNALHCCAEIDIEQVLRLSPTHLSFDARFVKAPELFLKTLIENKITPVVGIISTHKEYFSRLENHSLWIKVLRNFSNYCWLSPACGLGNFSIEESEQVLQELLSIKSEILQFH
jgi:hypothetical protein